MSQSEAIANMNNGTPLSIILAILLPVVTFIAISSIIPPSIEWSFSNNHVWGTSGLGFGDSVGDTMQDISSTDLDIPEKIEVYWFEVNHFYDGIYNINYKPLASERA